LKIRINEWLGKVKRLKKERLKDEVLQNKKI
jgi:hypothetical protein